MTSRYFKYKSRQNSPFVSTKQKKSRWFIYMIRFLVLAVCLGTLYTLFMSPIFAIKDIEIEVISEYSDLNVPHVSKPEIQSIASRHLHENALPLLKKNNFFLFHPSDLIEKLENTLPIKNSTITKTGIDSLKITVEEKTVSAIWYNLDNHYYIDDQGIILSLAEIEPYFVNVSIDEVLRKEFQNKQVIEIQDLTNDSLEEKQEIQKEIISENDLTPEELDEYEKKAKEMEVQKLLDQGIERHNAYIDYALLRESGGQPNEGMPIYSKEQFFFPVIYDNQREERQIGDQVVTNSYVSFLKNLHSYITEYTNSEAILYKSPSIMHPRIDVYLKSGYWIYLSSTEDLVDQLNSIALVLEQKVNYPQELEYIDVRFSDKVYFKYKEQERVGI